MAADMEEAEFLEQIRRRVASSGIDPVAMGFRLVHTDQEGARRWRYGRDADADVNNVIWVSFPRLKPDVMEHCVRSTRDWWRSERERLALAAAAKAVFGDGSAPYLVDDVILNHFAARGMPFDVFAAAMRREFGGTSVERRLREGANLVFSSFTNWVPEAFIPYRWRSPDVLLGSAFAALGDIQFRLSGSGGYGMIAYFDVAPDAFWCGGPSPRLWLRSGVEMPQTLMTAARRRPLTDVVGHPTLEVDGLVIHSVAKERERLSKNEQRERISLMVASVRSDVSQRMAALPLAA